eukprot:TRINITY_DN11501_c0_g1_i2.p1 TRINITY_DN11501_c0_g1~~TRINITY_DN11501_c0_g1_i2.p1  ORF type:complete len:1254 (+),score=334.37 TRINITY_DN11501_c0_g1_i2:2090-5851(+)
MAEVAHINHGLPSNLPSAEMAMKQSGSSDAEMRPSLGDMVADDAVSLSSSDRSDVSATIMTLPGTTTENSTAAKPINIRQQTLEDSLLDRTIDSIPTAHSSPDTRRKRPFSAQPQRTARPVTAHKRPQTAMTRSPIKDSGSALTDLDVGQIATAWGSNIKAGITNPVPKPVMVASHIENAMTNGDDMESLVPSESRHSLVSSTALPVLNNPIKSVRSLSESTQLVTDKRKYIPLDVARARIQEIQEDMFTMRKAHLELMRKLESQYKEVQESHEEQHQSHLHKIKSHYESKLALCYEVLATHRQKLTAKCNELQSQLVAAQAANASLQVPVSEQALPSEARPVLARQATKADTTSQLSSVHATTPESNQGAAPPALVDGAAPIAIQQETVTSGSTEPAESAAEPIVAPELPASQPKIANAFETSDGMSIRPSVEHFATTHEFDDALNLDQPEKGIEIERTSEDGDAFEEDADPLSQDDDAADDADAIEGSSDAEELSEGTLDATVDDIADAQISQLESEVETLVQQLQAVKSELQDSKQALLQARASHEADIAQLKLKATTTEKGHAAAMEAMQREVDVRDKKIVDWKSQVSLLEGRLDSLEEERLAGVDVDIAAEVRELKARIATATKERRDLETQLHEEKEHVQAASQKLAEAEDRLQLAVSTSEKNDAAGKEIIVAMEAQIEDLKAQLVKAQQQERQMTSLERQVDVLSGQLQREKKNVAEWKRKAQEAKKAAAKAPSADTSSSGPSAKQLKQYEQEIAQLKVKLKKKGSVSGSSSAETQRLEKKLKDSEKRVEMYKVARAKDAANVEKLEVDLKERDKLIAKLQAEAEKLAADFEKAKALTETSMAKMEQLETLKVEQKELRAHAEDLAEQLAEERKLRKQYYNKIEDMKGKIRVYCRARPLSSTEKERECQRVVSAPDEFTIVVNDGTKDEEFQFDSVFMPEHGQEVVYEDTHNLVQSAVDGYNVCIFAYGQTGSGKTYTMIGDSNRPMTSPGLAPRAFQDIFELIAGNSSKFNFEVSCYMIELYCDKLRDLFAGKDQQELKVKLDQKKMVFVEGAIVKQADSAEHLYELFEHGSKSRKVASTKMNSESSRSHLVIGVIVKATSLADGKVTRGKLSLVDLAGSERAGKTGAEGQQIIEAKSINKSLSALGNVIAALSTKQKHVPYRDNLLTQLMQDSIGGNAKTLMFVNVSPADYNTDETINSLRYAKRVKTITNDAQKNAESEEIDRLKNIINKLKAGEQLSEDDVV